MRFFHLIPLLLLSLRPQYSSSATPNRYYTDCSPSPYTCGDQNFTISYPFRIDTRNDYCGYPNFRLTCNNDTGALTITIGNTDYLITTPMDYDNRLLNLTSTSILHQSCPQTLTNATIDPTLFQISDRNTNVTFFIDCNSVSTSVPNLYNLVCALGGDGGSSYYRLDNGTMDNVLGSCSSTAVIPMDQQTATEFAGGGISLGQALLEGFSVNWTPGTEWCSGCVVSGGRCGYNVTTPADHTCFCSNGTFVDTCNSANSESRNPKTLVLAASIGGTTAFLAACFGALCYYKRRKKLHQLLFQSTSQTSSLQTHNSKVSKNENFNIDQNIEGFLEKYGSLHPKRYKYSMVKRMTKSFGHKLGQGAYGSVFIGTLSDGRVVAVKILSNSKGNGDDFVNEIASIGRSSHVNVVNLVGFCSEGTKRALLYEYMCNGSLDKLISSEKQKATPDWEKLYRIATGVARGLEYLHRGCNTKIVHFDIKPHNILLDQDFGPKISDFGLAMLCQRKDSILSMEGMRGTMGYIAPEVFSRNFGVVSSKSDIYSYGMMMLEMAGGRKKVQGSVQSNSDTYFPSWIYKKLEQDEDVQGANSETEDVVRKMLLIGLWCIQTLPNNRPSITKVIDMLEGNISDLHLPPKPCLSLGSLTDVVTVYDSCYSSEVP